MKLALSLWMLYLAILPLYVFKSGNVQPSHAIFMLAFGVMLMENRKAPVNAQWMASPLGQLMARRGRLVCVLFGLFAIYVSLVNAVWAGLLSSFKPLLFSAFQTYNLLLVYFIARMVTADFKLFAQYTRRGFFLALFLVVGSIGVTGFASATRESGLFNNPNQLAFFSLSCCLIFFAMDKMGIGSSSWNKVALVMGCFVCLLSLSRAGLAGCALILLTTVIDGSGRASKMVIASVCGVTLVLFAGSLQVLDRLEARNQQMQATIDPVEGRGYDRMIQYPQYMLLGAGEGEYKRFEGFLSSMGAEMHSSIGTLLFSYGLIGFSLYASIWYLMVMAGPGLAFKLCALAPIVYGLTHNGLRFSAAIIATMLMIFAGLAASNTKKAKFL